MDFVVLLPAVVAYFLGWYAIAFWLFILLITNSVLGTARAFIDPDWYANKRLKATGQYIHPGASLLISKAVLLALLSASAYALAVKAGYLSN
ncbi:hypothetical protein [Pseudohalocynthiibacter sp. F2068]|uniref:hypothetical protein n=1 Tax=Pseudohalocynthiibacter sp. F2068 TaxID=2926418 RepID=UPI001FF21F6A|nr:hypothetical protein [Pseudohalocynthiibacter sp. F2068]MCK0104388.1 hypothetical protein [Pseudohalocynthiibacter sp. F2068]